MPRKVPTSAAATLCPICSGGPPRAPMVITTPNTAATIPSPGKESATVVSAWTGCCAWWWWTSMSSSIICSRSQGVVPFREQFAFGRFLHIRLNSCQALLPGLVHHQIHLMERVEVVHPGKPGGAEDTLQAGQYALEDAGRIADQDGTGGSPADDHQFGWLHEHLGVSLLQQISSQHCSENDENANNAKHAGSVLEKRGLGLIARSRRGGHRPARAAGGTQFQRFQGIAALGYGAARGDVHP